MSLTKTSSQAVRGYLEQYAEQLSKQVVLRHSCLLLGPAGIGKSDVLLLLVQLLQKRPFFRHRSVVVDVDARRLMRGPQAVSEEIVQELNRQNKKDHSTPRHSALNGSKREWLKSWLDNSSRDLIVAIDHVEELNRSMFANEVYKEFRALYEERALATSLKPTASQFVIVFASNHALRETLAGEKSPLHGMLVEIEMKDCEASLRQKHWRDLLSKLNRPNQTRLGAEFDRLCGGDHYQIQKVSAKVIGILAKHKHPNIAAKQIDLFQQRLCSAPESVVGLLEKVREHVEQDPDMLMQIVRLLHGDRLPIEESGSYERDRFAHLPSSLFTREAGEIRIRNELSRLYLKRAFLDSPSTVARALSQKNRHDEATRYMAENRAAERELMRTLREVSKAWLQHEPDLDKAWQALAQIVGIWFVIGAEVFQRRAPNVGDASQTSNLMNVNSMELLGPDDPKLIRIQQAVKVNTDHGVYSTHEVGGVMQDDVVYYPVVYEEQMLGCVLLPEQTIETALPGIHPSDQRRQLGEFVGDIAGVLFEKLRRQKPMEMWAVLEEVRNCLLSPQRQPNANSFNLDLELNVILTALTHGSGLEFNRCVLLNCSKETHLQGRMAIGQRTQKEAIESWTPPDDRPLREVFKQLSNRPKAMTLDDTVVKFSADLHNGDLLSELINSPKLGPHKVSRQQVAQSLLGKLLAVDKDAKGQNNPAYITFIWDSDDVEGHLAGVLYLDKVFTRLPADETLVNEFLPRFVSLIESVLRRERLHREGKVYEKLDELSLQRKPLQDTLEAIADLIEAHCPDSLCGLVLSLWDETPERENENRRQESVRIRRVFSEDKQESVDSPIYAYHDRDEKIWGPVAQAIKDPSGEWKVDQREILLEQGGALSELCHPEVHSLYSVALRVGVATDKEARCVGAIAFLGRAEGGYSRQTQAWFRNLSIRIAPLVDKARVYEGMQRNIRQNNVLGQAQLELTKIESENTFQHMVVKQASRLFDKKQDDLPFDDPPDSIALIQWGHRVEPEVLNGEKPDLARNLCENCRILQRDAMDNEILVRIECASAELVARDWYNEAECGHHFQAGAEASLWVKVDQDTLLVLAWKKPRRISASECNALAMLVRMAASMRPNNFDADKRRDALAAYKKIEGVIAHEWGNRAIQIGRHIDEADEALGWLPKSNGVKKVRRHLRKIKVLADEAVGKSEIVLKVEALGLSDVYANLSKLVEKFNKPTSVEAQGCELLPLDGDANQTIEVVRFPLEAVVYELLVNARKAESRAPSPCPYVRLRVKLYAREWVVSVENSATFEKENLERIRSGQRVIRRDTSGLGLNASRVIVSDVLGGRLDIPEVGDIHTTVSVRMPIRRSEIWT